MVSNSHLPKPSPSNPKELFEYCVKTAIAKDFLKDACTHQQWANKLFGYEKKSYVKVDMMSKVKREYGLYFTSDLKYSFDVDRIKSHFPDFFGLEEDDEDDDSLEGYFRAMDKALGREIIEQKDPRNVEIFEVKGLRTITHINNLYVYRAVLKMRDGDDPQFSEGTTFSLKLNGRRYECETIEFDAVEAHLYFTCPIVLYWTPPATIITDATFNLLALKNSLRGIINEELNEDYPFFKFIAGDTDDVKTVKHGAYPLSLIEALDESQQKAFNAALDKDLTFIWGPPGTGKSFTLASIIMALYDMGEDRTAVCCLSNVAVDQLVNKVVDFIEKENVKMPSGEFYRAGRSRDDRIIATDFLYPNDKVTKELRASIKRKRERLQVLRQKNQQFSEDAITLKAINKELYEKLREQTEYLVRKSRVVFSTISNFILNTSLSKGPFENLIVDEASMLSIPNLIALGSKISKRIILVGDFQQLSPIAMVEDAMLQENVFQSADIGMNNTDHPALYQLLNQRRSNKRIVDMINDVFYGNKLVARNIQKNPISSVGPFSNNIVGLKQVDDGHIRFTKGGTRQNTANATAVIELLSRYHNEDGNFSIGIITPYKGQVALIKALIREEGYSDEFLLRLKVGTVHTFQGSESDVIIFDMVDCSYTENGRQSNIGKIYAGEDGERLLNVAISRARHKLIVVGELDFIKKVPGNKLTTSSHNIFNQIYNLRYTKE